MLVVVLGALVAACSSDDGAPPVTGRASSGGDGPTTPAASPSAGPTPRRPDLEDARIRLVPVAELEQPVAMAVRAGDRELYVAEKVGRVVALTPGSDPRVVLHLTNRVSLGSEQGLLGLAFSPDGRYLYVDFTDTEGDTNVAEFAFDDDGADPESERPVLFVDQPFSNHNGGALAFGPDGYLYVALGDGGSGGDPMGNAQSLSTLLGKLLRISPRPSGGEPYAIPPDNPFVGRSGARPEIWAYGLRNPWRFSFDAETGDMWIGDVGQNAWEEIDLEPAASDGGSNFGWARLEGTHPFEGGSAPGSVPPVFEYANGGGSCAVTGGYVYRGELIPALAGAYVFADYCGGRLEAFVPRNGRATQARFLGPRVDALASFGEDARGELYVLSLAGTVFRIAA
ncbi:MAG TPA: PQQ-dependent sugar dehydrogenase [Actinomycetota bacterium]